MGVAIPLDIDCALVSNIVSLARRVALVVRYDIAGTVREASEGSHTHTYSCVTLESKKDKSAMAADPCAYACMHVCTHTHIRTHARVRTATNNGVPPPCSLSYAFTSAFALHNMSTTSAWPTSAATKIGVIPLLHVRCGSAPLDNNSLTISRNPSCEAM